MFLIKGLFTPSVSGSMNVSTYINTWKDFNDFIPSVSQHWCLQMGSRLIPKCQRWRYRSVWPRLNGSFTLHWTGTGIGTRKQWVSILCIVLYTLHRDRDREPLFSIVSVPVPVPVPVPVRAVCMSYKNGRWPHICTIWNIRKSTITIDSGSDQYLCTENLFLNWFPTVTNVEE